MIAIQPLTIETWNDFVTLMNTDSQCSECWCLNHREAAGCATGLDARLKMKQLTEENKVGGLLAYKGNESIGWVAVDPISHLVGHDCRSSGKVGEWSIHCLFVKEGHRGRGVSSALIRGAVDFARARGGDDDYGFSYSARKPREVSRQPG